MITPLPVLFRFTVLRYDHALHPHEYRSTCICIEIWMCGTFYIQIDVCIVLFVFMEVEVSKDV